MKHLKPKEAYDFLQQNPHAVLIDCRSEMEYLFVGHPLGSHHVACGAQRSGGSGTGR